MMKSTVANTISFLWLSSSSSSSLGRSSAFSNYPWQSLRRTSIGRPTRSCQSLSTFLPPLPEDPLERAFYAFSVLAKKEKSWQRFRHMIDLAVDNQSTGTIQRSVTDVGTDHGLLAVGLALSGRFKAVLGVDVSPNALKQGGLKVLDKVQDKMNNDGASNDLPLEFRVSDGLQKVRPGEADVVCIAGMGVNVMEQILKESTNNILELDRLGCQQIILQPTNSRPRNLIQLYDLLQQSGWTLQDERIEYIATRWYLSSCFVKALSTSTKQLTNTQIGTTTCLPTAKLASLEENETMKMVTRDYWDHHLNWIQMEEKASGGKLKEDDKRWRDWVFQMQSNMHRKSIGEGNRRIPENCGSNPTMT